MKKKLRRYVWTLTILSVIVGIGIVEYRQVGSLNTITTVNDEKPAPVINTDSSDADLTHIMQEPGFQASQKLQARKILVQRQKDTEEARHKSEVDRLEKELTDIRSQEVQLGEKTASFQ